MLLGTHAYWRRPATPNIPGGGIPIIPAQDYGSTDNASVWEDPLIPRGRLPRRQDYLPIKQSLAAFAGKHRSRAGPIAAWEPRPPPRSRRRDTCVRPSLRRHDLLNVRRDACAPRRRRHAFALSDFLEKAFCDAHRAGRAQELPVPRSSPHPASIGRRTTSSNPRRARRQHAQFQGPRYHSGARVSYSSFSSSSGSRLPTNRPRSTLRFFALSALALFTRMGLPCKGDHVQHAHSVVCVVFTSRSTNAFAPNVDLAMDVRKNHVHHRSRCEKSPTASPQ